jgi:hypothetical protein
MRNAASRADRHMTSHHLKWHLAAVLLQVGSFLGLMSDRGRGSIASYVGNVVYNIVALGLMAMVGGTALLLLFDALGVCASYS